MNGIMSECIRKIQMRTRAIKRMPVEKRLTLKMVLTLRDLFFEIIINEVMKNEIKRERTE